MATHNILEITIETPQQGNLYLQAAGFPLRGRKDYAAQLRTRPSQRILELSQQFPRGVPGTLVRIDMTDEIVTLIEPLKTPEWATEAEQIKERGIAIPNNIEIKHPHIANWLHELKRAINSGCAQVVSGKFPDDLGEEEVSSEPATQSDDRIDRLCDVVEKLLDRLTVAAAK